MKYAIIAACGLAFAATGFAKLPAPTPEQQAAAALAAAKTAHAAKVDAYKLCLAQAKIADAYLREQKARGKDYAPEATPACVDAGPFVPPTATPVATSATAQPTAAPAQPAAAAAKK